MTAHALLAAAPTTPARVEHAEAFCRRRAAENLAGWDAVALVLAELDRCREQLAEANR